MNHKRMREEKSEDYLKLISEVLAHQSEVRRQIAAGEFDFDAWARRLAKDVGHLTD